MRIRKGFDAQNCKLQSLYYVASLVSGQDMNQILRCDWPPERLDGASYLAGSRLLAL